MVASYQLPDEPPPLSRYVPAAPAELNALIARLLAKDRSARYQSARNLLGELKSVQQRLWVAREADGVAQAAQAIERSQTADRIEKRESSSASSTRRSLESLAVLPFVTLSQDPNVVYLAEGISESLIRNLSRLSQLRVMAWSTVARFRGLEPDPLETGRTLGVRAVFTARMHQLADTLIIRAELLGSNGEPIASETKSVNVFVNGFVLTPDTTFLAAAHGSTFRLRRYTEHTITRRGAFREELARIEEQGYALVDQELEDGLRALAVPIHDAEDRVIASVNVAVHTSRWPLDRIQRELLPRLLELAAAVERDVRATT